MKFIRTLNGEYINISNINKVYYNRQDHRIYVELLDTTRHPLRDIEPTNSDRELASFIDEIS